MWLVSGFDGIVDDWEQRKLGELMSFSNGVNAEKHAYGHGIKMISVMDILDKGRLTYETVRNSVQLEPSAERVARVNNDDLVFVRSSETPTEAGWAKVYSSETPAVHSGFTIKGKKLGLYDGLFVESFLNTIGRHQLNAFASGSTHFNIGQSALIQTTVSFPLLAEQHQIADLIELLEGALALHERKLALLKKLKTAYLQRLFPENGNTTPRLRFAGFADDWEQRKFKDIYEKVIEKNDLTISRDRVISVAQMQWGKRPDKSTDEYMKSYNIMRIGDIAFEGNKSKNFRYGRFVENTLGTGLVSHVFDVFRPKIRLDFGYWKYYIHTERVMGPVLRVTTTKSTMMTNLVAKDFLKHDVRMPGQDEQKKIASFILSLDNAITLHQRVIDKLQQLKQAYLQKLFV